LLDILTRDPPTPEEQAAFDHLLEVLDALDQPLSPEDRPRREAPAAVGEDRQLRAQAHGQ
jgi:hypothetical protein